MSKAIKPKICAYCGHSFSLSGGNRYKYCSDECALQAHRKQCRENFRRRYAIQTARELRRNRDYYARNHEKAAKRRFEYYHANPDKFQRKKIAANVATI